MWLFRDLGLVIIDEEQWFGVKPQGTIEATPHSSRRLDTHGHPDPRTLQMAMASVLISRSSRPLRRALVHSHTGRPIERHAHPRGDIARTGAGGQVYFVHNRVETMEKTGAWLRQLVPDARIVMAHGQMTAKPLEAVMLKFFRREADVLIRLGHIQSGIERAPC